MKSIIDIAKEYNRVDRIRYHMVEVKEMIDNLNISVELDINKEVVAAVNNSIEPIQKYNSMLYTLVKEAAKKSVKQNIFVMDIVKDYMAAVKAQEEFWKVEQYMEYLISICGSDLDYAVTKSVEQVNTVLSDYIRLLENVLKDMQTAWPPEREFIYKMEDEDGKTE